MEQIILDLVGQPLFKVILKEWSFHVKTEQDPTMFSNMYMEWMRDPGDHMSRKATTQFLNFIRARDWQEAMRVIGPGLDLEVAAIFRSEAAGNFYRGWRDRVVQNVQNYWEEWLLFRKKKGAEEIGPRDWSPRAGYCWCGDHPSKCTCKRPLP
jgi:hypothetical protein